MREPGHSLSSQTNLPCRVRRGVPQVSAAFSLIEMLITVTIILILFSMMYGFGSANHQKKQKNRCADRLQKTYLAMQIYANDHAGKFPEVAGAQTSEAALDLLVPRYTADTSIFICPGSKDAMIPSGESIRDRRISYAYYMGRRPAETAAVLMTDRQVDARPKNKNQYVFSTDGKPPGNNHHKFGGNFLFCDGRVEPVSFRAQFSLVLTQNVVLLNPKP